MFLGCTHAIKNSDAQVEEEEGTAVTDNTSPSEPDESEITSLMPEQTKESNGIDSSDPIGYWVGYFEQDEEKMGERKEMWLDDGIYWNRNNKINISIDEIRDTIVMGHSVVAGNDRPFKGTVEKIVDQDAQSIIYAFQVKEPGDDPYDGVFSFKLLDGKLMGTWEAFNNINIKYRKFNLEKKKFTYDPNIQLEDVRIYVDWKKETKKTHFQEQDGDDVYEWMREEFATATHKIYEINASNTLLTKEDVENLVRGDLTIIRNTIYARHGYSFKNQPLRVFFDAQSWYIPVHADIRDDFTEIELKNIKLLLNYEKNAAEYYDSFGRG